MGLRILTLLFRDMSSELPFSFELDLELRIAIVYFADFYVTVFNSFNQNKGH